MLKGVSHRSFQVSNDVLNQLGQQWLFIIVGPIDFISIQNNATNFLPYNQLTFNSPLL